MKMLNHPSIVKLYQVSLMGGGEMERGQRERVKLLLDTNHKDAQPPQHSVHTVKLQVNLMGVGKMVRGP